jgi:glucose/arabinose dehydrogenase/PKD repeat protein
MEDLGGDMIRSPIRAAVRIADQTRVGVLIAVAVVALVAPWRTIPAAESAEPSVTGPMFRTAAEPQLEPAAVPSGFQDQIVFSGLTFPTAISFAPDGRVFVAEKSGLIKGYDDLDDTSPTTVADLRTNVYNFWDRGLLGMAVSPGFPGDPSLYVLYSYDHILGTGGSAPHWGTPGATSDPCPNPPGANTDGCLSSARLSRLTIGGGGTSTGETVLLEDWCIQYPSHSIGDVVFGPDGSLYVSGGDGASFTYADWGQGPPGGTSAGDNACGDPPVPAGTAQTLPDAQGGSLRSRDVVLGNDPVGLDGTILRIDPSTGAGWPTNPQSSSSDVNARRIRAFGLRNPLRFVLRPGTSELWAGDVGDGKWEEIDRIQQGSSLFDAGWPCYEGANRHVGWDGVGVKACDDLYAAGGASNPYYAYDHAQSVVAGDGCPTASGSSIAGLAFYSGTTYPTAYRDALFFADYTRGCIWVMRKGGNGLPDPSQISLFLKDAGPVQLKTGPGGDIFYVDYDGGAIHRFKYVPADQPPNASFTANPTVGPAPLSVQFDGRGSNDPDQDPLTYAWDLDGDGQFDDSTSATPSRTYSQTGKVTVRLRVSDGIATDIATGTISVGRPPSPTIDTPATSVRWAVGDTIQFSGHASSEIDGTIPASGLSWEVVVLHCPSACHEHVLQTFDGTASGSFAAPDHSYPSALVLRLTARDSVGLETTTSVQLQPATVTLTLSTNPAGGSVVVDTTSYATPATVTVIRGSAHTIAAQTPQTFGGVSQSFLSWSDGGAQSHSILASGDRSFTATFSGADPVAPTMSWLRPGFVPSGSVHGTAPGRIRWTGSDVGTGIASYELQMSKDAGATWTAVPLAPATRTYADVALAQSLPYQFRVRAQDGAGNRSAWMTSAVVRMGVAQDTSATQRYGGSWATVNLTTAWGGTLHRTSRFGAALSYRFTGRAIAWIAPRGGTHGKVRVYLDGVLKATVDLGQGSGPRRLIFVTDFSTSGTHTIRIANLATPGKPYLEHDAFAVLR